MGRAPVDAAAIRRFGDLLRSQQCGCRIAIGGRGRRRGHPRVDRGNVGRCSSGWRSTCIIHIHILVLVYADLVDRSHSPVDSVEQFVQFVEVLGERRPAVDQVHRLWFQLGIRPFSDDHHHATGPDHRHHATGPDHRHDATVPDHHDHSTGNDDSTDDDNDHHSAAEL
ncbi:MAG: hypothetical protein ACYCV7_16580 [Acidimicrobiales bacterium]